MWAAGVVEALICMCSEEASGRSCAEYGGDDVFFGCSRENPSPPPCSTLGGTKRRTRSGNVGAVDSRGSQRVGLMRGNKVCCFPHVRLLRCHPDGFALLRWQMPGGGE